MARISTLNLAMCNHLDLALAWWVTTFIKEIIAAFYGSAVLLSEVDIIQFKRRYYLTLCSALLLYLTTYDRINIYQEEYWVSIGTNARKSLCLYMNLSISSYIPREQAGKPIMVEQSERVREHGPAVNVQLFDTLTRQPPWKNFC